MTLVDFGHLSARLMYISILSSKPKKKNGQFVTSEFAPLYFHLLFDNLKHIKNNYQGDVVICLDGNGSWRKREYPLYKANRVKDSEKDEINWDEWYSYVNEVIEVIKNYFPFKTIGVKDAEADDIIAVLAKEYSSSEEIIVYSEDKDFFQLLDIKGVKQYRPISKQWVKMTNQEVQEYKIKHSLLGDSVDNIPRIVDETEFSEAFKTYLRQNEIFETNVLNFLNMKISKKLIEEYQVFKKITNGKKKGQFSDIKDIYKTVMFGDKAVKNFMDDLELNLQRNNLYTINYNRNKKLILFENIPSDISEDILDTFIKSEKKFNSTKILEFFNKYLLREQVKNASVFFDTRNAESDLTFDW